MQLALSVDHISIQEVIQSLVTTVYQRKKINFVIGLSKKINSYCIITTNRFKLVY